MKNIHSFSIAAILGIVLVFSGVQPVFAQQSTAAPTGQGNGLRIAPIRFEQTIEKGRSETVSVNVENITGLPMNIRAVINDFVPSDKEGGEPRLILDESKSAPGNSFKKLVGKINNVTLQPGDRKEVKINLSVPGNASSGGYYGAVRWAPATEENDKSVALAASAGSLFLIKVPGQITEKLSVESFSVTKDDKPGSLFSSGPLEVRTRFRNFGNIHVQPFGKILIKNTNGKILQEIEINHTDPRASVLPASIRKFEDAIKPKLPIGKYTAEGYFGYGASGELISAKKTFYVFPLPLIIAIVAGVFLLIFSIPWFFKKYRISRRR
jgi:hypothetical protein